MSNQEMQFADPDWKPTQQLDKKASPQEREAYRPQPINADPREQQQWRAAQVVPPQQEGYAGLPPYAGVAPQQMQGRDFRQPQYRRRGRGPWFWIICAIILISLMSGGLGFPHTRFGNSPIEEKPIHYTVKGQPTIVINDTDGAIHVVAGKSNNDVTIQAVRQNNFFGNPNDMQVKYDQNGNKISANVQESGPGSVDLNVTVPQGTNLQLKTDSGDINIDGVNGQMNLKTDSGNIHALNDTLSDSSSITTNSGDINFAGTIGTSGSYQFQTDSGSVNLNGLGASEFHLVASTNSGSINVPGVSVQPNEPGPGSKASGDIGGNSQGQGATVTIATGSGDINLNQQ
jgi:Putative adhesin